MPEIGGRIMIRNRQAAREPGLMGSPRGDHGSSTIGSATSSHVNLTPPGRAPHGIVLACCNP